MWDEKTINDKLDAAFAVYCESLRLLYPDMCTETMRDIIVDRARDFDPSQVFVGGHHA